MSGFRSDTEREAIMAEREFLKSRLGFILLSAGCAIGLGNVWRFPFIVGQYGGAAFVVLYLFSAAAIGKFATADFSEKQGDFIYVRHHVTPCGKLH